MHVAKIHGGDTSDGGKRSDEATDGILAFISRSDLYRGFSAAPLWTLLGWNDIRLRYRRSVLGPFWITLSMSVLIVVLGVIYSQIFHQDIRSYLPYLALGFIVWGFIATSISESCGAFVDGERMIKQIGIPLSVYVLRVLWRNFIVFLHTVILVIPIWLIFQIIPSGSSLLALPGIALVFLNQCWLGISVALISTRYRDIPPIILTLLQIAIFATPIMWPVSSLGDNHIIADVNPFYHLIEIVRGPLIGEVPSRLSWEVAIIGVIVGTIFAAWLLEKTRRKVVYWL
jgi:ABC-type polysaccharide/polyol phosphate export permease